MTEELKNKFTVWFQQYGKLSAPFLQRHLKIGYKEALRLIEEYEKSHD